MTNSTNNTSELHVIFGSGQIGRGIINVLCEQGKRVRVVNRSGGDFPPGVENVRGDASDPAFTTQAAEGATHIYQTLNPPYDKWLDLFRALQAGVMAAAEASGAKLIVLENLYAYGHTSGQPMTESTPFNPHTRKGKLRAGMTRDLIDAHEKGRVRMTIGRASDFVGPRGTDTMLGERVVVAAIQGKAAQVVGNPELPHTYSYTDDVARALVTLGGHDNAIGEVWHIPNAPARTTRAWIEAFYAETGQPFKLSVAPKPVLWLMGLFNPLMREVNEMIYEFEEPFVVDHSKYAAAFGETYTPVDDAVRQTVAWFHQNHA